MSFRQKFKLDLEAWCDAKLSRFFYQEPRGSGTGLHESLPSFVQRLAQRHAVPNGPFFLQEVHPEPVPSSGSLLGRHSRCLLVGNGYAKEVASKVARQCVEKNVVHLVQAPLSEHIALFRDVRPYAAWCPSCLSEWKNQEKEIYRPLLWSLKSANICPRHKLVLHDRCPHCSKLFYHFSPTRWTVDCPSCGNSILDGKKVYQRTKFEVFAANAICELLKWGWQCTGDDFPPDQFRLNIRQAVDAVGGEYRMSSITGLSRAAIHAWRTEDRRPSLQGLVHLSYSFELPIKSWVTDKLTTSTFSSKQPRTIGETALNQRHPPLKHVRRRLLAILGDASATPCSLAELARQLNTTSHRLYRDCPELATRAVARYAEFRKVQKQERRHTQQEAVRRAIRDVAANYDGQISRSAVLELLQLRGFKSSWTLKQIFAEEIQKS